MRSGQSEASVKVCRYLVRNVRVVTGIAEVKPAISEATLFAGTEESNHFLSEFGIVALQCMRS